MKFWRWRTVLLSVLFALALFGASGYVMGYREKSSEGTQTIGGGVAEKDQLQGQSRMKTPVNTDSMLSIAELEAASARNDPRLQVSSVKISEPIKENTSENVRITLQTKSELELIGIPSANTEILKEFPSPVQGKLIRKPGNYYSESLQAYLFHAGMDFAQAEGAVIRIKHSGKVTYAGPDPLLGQKVEIDCGDAWSTVYGGLENLRVKEGDYVEVNQAIGQVGYYPNAEGIKEPPHLHYEIWHGDEVVIPDLIY